MIEELIEIHYLEQYERGDSAVWEGKAAPRLLDENKTLQENGVGDGAYIRIVKEIIIKVGHPSNGMVSDIAVEETMTINDMIEELIEVHFLEQYELGYAAILEDESAPRLLDENKNLKENGVGNGAVIRFYACTMYIMTLDADE